MNKLHKEKKMEDEDLKKKMYAFGKITERYEDDPEIQRELWNDFFEKMYEKEAENYLWN